MAARSSISASVTDGSGRARYGRASPCAPFLSWSMHASNPAGNPMWVCSGHCVELRLSRMLPFRRADLDAIFLDAGNTLITLDYTLLCDALEAEGIRATPARLARAEAAARPAVSRLLGGSRSSEGRDTFVFYVRQILAGLGTDGPDADELAGRLVTT